MNLSKEEMKKMIKAAQEGDIKLITDFLNNESIPKNNYIIKILLEEAVEYNKIEIIKFIIRMMNNEYLNYLTENLSSIAAEKGHLDILKFLASIGYLNDIKAYRKAYKYSDINSRSKCFNWLKNRVRSDSIDSDNSESNSMKYNIDEYNVRYLPSLALPP